MDAVCTYCGKEVPGSLSRRTTCDDCLRRPRVFRVEFHHVTRYETQPKFPGLERVEVILEAETGNDASRIARKALGPEWTLRCVNVMGEGA